MFGHDLESAVLEDGDDAAAHALPVRQVDEDRVAWPPSGVRLVQADHHAPLGLCGPGCSYPEAGADVLDAVRAQLAEGQARDMAGTAGTAEFTRALLDRLRRAAQ
jgi:hypothetical protein